MLLRGCDDLQCCYYLAACVRLCAQLKPTMPLLLSERDSSARTNPQILQLNRSSELRWDWIEQIFSIRSRILPLWVWLRLSVGSDELSDCLFETGVTVSEERRVENQFAISLRLSLLGSGLHQWVLSLPGISRSVFESGDRRMRRVRPFSFFAYDFSISKWHSSQFI